MTKTMETRAVMGIILPGPALPDGGDPRLLKVAGLTMLERQLRTLARLGIEDAVVIGDVSDEALCRKIKGFRRVPERIEVLGADAGVTAALGAPRDYLFVSGAVAVDDRIFDAVLGASAPTAIAVRSAEGEAAGAAFAKDGKDWQFAACAKIGAAGLTTIADHLAARVGQDLMGLVLDCAQAPDAVLVDIDTIPAYLENRRREVPLVLHPVTSAKAARVAATKFLDTAQKGTLDWPAWYIHRPIENFIVRLLWRTPVTPNQVTLLTGALGFGVTYLFATGAMGLALGLALVVGIFDGVDGKLARSKLLVTRVGEMEHFLDKLTEYSWYLAIAYFLGRTTGLEVPYVLAVGLVLFHIADEVQSEFFRRTNGRQICDTGAFDRWFRRIGGRRNTYMWSLIPFAVMDAWMAGLYFIALYGVATFFVHQWRIIAHTLPLMHATSETIRHNLERTKIF